MIKGRCLISSDNVELYRKVLHRLKKDKLVFTEDFNKAATWGDRDTTVTGPAILITYHSRGLL